MSSRSTSRPFWVVVLGDFGRSPRMQYHTLSLSQQPGAQVVVIAYSGSQPISQLTQSSNVKIRSISEAPAWMQRFPRPLQLIFKVLYLLVQLAWLMLVNLPSPQAILMQTPPAIPTMAVCWLAAVRHRARLLFDWHNFGYTILALTQGKRHWLVWLAHKYELYWGRSADGHFCVTRAMQQELKDNWNISATVLYDRPPAFFKRTPVQQVHSLFSRLAPSLHDSPFSDCLPRWLPAAQQGDSASQTLATTLPSDATAGPGTQGAATSSPSWRSSRPAIVISSTSWTPDEDFSILLEAGQLYDQAACQGSGLPDVVFLITGKGPQKEMYMNKLRNMRFEHVAFRSLWLEASDYPLLLGAADVGVSLHASSSGLDLPMKVVDMFGSGLPVCALSYSCINELVKDGHTGLLFSNAEQLSQHLQTLLHGFPSKPSKQLQHMQAIVAEQEQGLRWDQNWQQVAWPVLSGKQGNRRAR